MRSEPFGIDISSNNGQMIWPSVQAHGVEFVGIRTGRGSAYQDKFFPRNWAGAATVSFGGVPIPRLPYHVLLPKEPATPQASNWFRICPPGFVGRRVIDFELLGDGFNDPAPTTGAVASDRLWELAQLCLSEDGFLPYIYSRVEFLNRTILVHWSRAQVGSFSYWLAQYVTLPGVEDQRPILLPPGMTKEMVLIHQTADHTLSDGMTAAAPAGSKQLDYNRWLGAVPPKDFFGTFQTPTAAERLKGIRARLLILADEIAQVGGTL